MFPFEAFDPHTAIPVVMVTLVAMAALVVVGLIIAAVISILFSPEDLGMKAVWLLFVCIAPFIGALAWFLVGFNHSRSHTRGGNRQASRV